MDTALLRRRAAVPLVVAALGLTACSASDDSDGDGGVAADSEVAAEAPAPASVDGVFGEDAAARNEAGQPAGGDEQVGDTQIAGQSPRAIISKGTVSLRSRDVGQARFDVGKVVDAHAGEIADEKTETDDDGRVTRSRLVVRVPVADFDEAMNELQKVAQLSSASRNSEDVTTEVIDTDVRIRAQAESLQRVELLLARAQSIRDIVAIEAQLTRRQADLDSLKQRQAYLADQTSMSTITVYLERTHEQAPPKKDDASGFVAGLGNGWDGMTTFLTGLATVTGTLLPFAVLLLLVGVPGWLLVRSVGRRRPGQPATVGPMPEE